MAWTCDRHELVHCSIFPSPLPSRETLDDRYCSVFVNRSVVVVQPLAADVPLSIPVFRVSVGATSSEDREIQRLHLDTY